MKSRRQAFQFCLDTVVIVVIKILNQFSFEVVYGIKFLEIKQYHLILHIPRPTFEMICLLAARSLFS